MKSSLIYYLKILAVVFVISLPIIFPYLKPGYFPTHDGEWAVVRLSDMFRELRDFQIPPRYSGDLNFGYGYPLFNFVYPPPYYLGLVIHFFGLSFVDSIKSLFFVSVPLSAFFMFLASKKIWKNTQAGLISAVFYAYFPYRIVDLYVRGSLGESLAFVLFPLIIFLFLNISEEKKDYFFVPLASLCLGLLIMTHNIMSVFFGIILLVFIVYSLINNRNLIGKYLVFILLGFGISSFFSLPALLEKKNILLSVIPIADRNIYFVTLKQLILPKWGYGVPTEANGFSYQLGISYILIFLLSIWFFLINLFKHKLKRDYLIPLIFLIVLFIVLMFKPTRILWENIPLLSEINYPWTLLGPLGFLISLLAGFLAIKKISIRIVTLVLIIFAIVMILPYAKPNYFVNRGDSFYLTNLATTTSSNELMPLWVKNNPKTNVGKKAEILRGEGQIEIVKNRSNDIRFNADLATESTVRINTIYYPGWTIKDENGKILTLDYKNDYGVMDIRLNKGKHFIKASFGETNLRLAADMISILSFGIFFLFLFYFFKFKRS